MNNQLETDYLIKASLVNDSFSLQCIDNEFFEIASTTPSFGIYNKDINKIILSRDQNKAHGHD